MEFLEKIRLAENVRYVFREIAEMFEKMLLTDDEVFV
jgi:hypothetical protein